MDTAACFTCSTEVAEDFAYRCLRGREDVEYDLLYNRVAHEIWRDRPGPAQQIAEALAAFAAERERYVQTLQELERRLSALAQQGPQHEHLKPSRSIGNSSAPAPSLSTHPWREPAVVSRRPTDSHARFRRIQVAVDTLFPSSAQYTKSSLYPLVYFRA
jgi:hypothetical protein